jgi:two-component system sensor histidine kinase PilS (NtrC family)
MAEVAETTFAAQAYAPRAAESSASNEFAWRILRLLNASRLVVSLVLALIFYGIRDPRVIGEEAPLIAGSVLGLLIVFSAAEAGLLRRRLGSAEQHAYAQGFADILLITVLLHTSGGISSGLAGLLVVSIPSLSLILPTDRALLLAAITSLALLIEQFLATAQGMTSLAEFAPTGILGAAIFTVTGVTQLLRRRLSETEALAEQRGVDLRNLVELNEYIIQHLRESLIVVDSKDRIRLINESAIKQMGGESVHPGKDLSDLSPKLAVYLSNWRAGNGEPGNTPTTFVASDGATRIEPHFARLGPNRDAGVLIFLEDTSLLAERVQQTKLAALGRLSASIAHEIRNPLGALSHAGQLLAESPAFTDAEHRLTDIIRVNAGRVSQIVESVLALSRGDTTQPESLQLKPWIIDFADEFTQTMELYEGSVCVTDDAIEVEVEIDPTHLHQIVWNLCDNAVKYASEAAGAIAVELCCGYLEVSGRPYLEIADRGAGIAPEQVEQIFEPFFTAQTGGTGLGLYISRELCERNGGTLSYHPRAGGGSRFRIVFADPQRWRLKSD